MFRHTFVFVPYTHEILQKIQRDIPQTLGLGATNPLGGLLDDYIPVQHELYWQFVVKDTPGTIFTEQKQKKQGGGGQPREERDDGRSARRAEKRQQQDDDERLRQKYEDRLRREYEERHRGDGGGVRGSPRVQEYDRRGQPIVASTYQTVYSGEPDPRMRQRRDSAIGMDDGRNYRESSTGERGRDGQGRVRSGGAYPPRVVVPEYRGSGRLAEESTAHRSRSHARPSTHRTASNVRQSSTRDPAGGRGSRYDR